MADEKKKRKRTKAEKVDHAFSLGLETAEAQELIAGLRGESKKPILKPEGLKDLIGTTSSVVDNSEYNSKAHIDRISGKKDSEPKELPEKLTNAHKPITSQSHHNHITISDASVIDHSDITDRSLYKHNTSTKQSHHNHITSTSLSQSDKKSVEITGATAIIFEWFQTCQKTDIFRNVEIQNATKMSVNTVSKCLKILEDLGIVSFSGYDNRVGYNTFKINPDVVVKITPNRHYFKAKEKLYLSQPKEDLSLSHHNHITITSLSQPSSNKKERKTLLNNLSFCLPDFWVNEGLTEQKINTWLEEFDWLTENNIETQLIFGANEPKVINAEKGPIRYFYGVLKKGGLSRPVGYETPKERAFRIESGEIATEAALLDEMRKAAEVRKANQKEIAFLKFMESEEAVDTAVNEIKSIDKNRKNIMVDIHKYEKFKLVSDLLEKRLRRFFESNT